MPQVLLDSVRIALGTAKLTLDIETFSRVDLKKVGLYRYAEDESTDLLCVCYAFGDGPVHAWVPTADWLFVPENIDGLLHVGPEVPSDLRAAIERRIDVHAWNAMFERRVLLGPAGRRYNFPELAIEQMRCSMHRARVHGLPGALEDSADALNTPVKKNIAGKNAMRYLCKPRKDGSQSSALNEYERFVRLVAYCADDVRAERACDAIVPEVSPYERKKYVMDQEINDRGVLIDASAVEDLIDIVEQYKRVLLQKCIEWTGIKPSQAGALAQWIRANGFPELENLQAATVRKALTQPLPEQVKKVLRLYSTYNMKSVTKLPTMLRAMCKDGRIHGMFLIQGAHTGRWSSIIVQLQNLMRPILDPLTGETLDADVAIKVMRERCLEKLQALYPGVDPMKVVGSCIRGMLIAPKGKKLLFPDYSGIEARYNAWMFNEEWKLKAYREYDAGEGPNLYCVVYGQCFSVPPDSKEGKAGKQIGKVLDLSMGYEGGVGAFMKMAAAYNIDLGEMTDRTWDTLPAWAVEQAQEGYELAVKQGRTYDLPRKVWVCCDALKRLWRRSHPRIVQGWKDLKEAAIGAIENPGTVTKVANGRLMFRVQDRWLYLRMPSGEKMAYYRPSVKKVRRQGMRDRNGEQMYDKVVYYYGMNTVTRQWGLTHTYGGKFCENETQKGCSEILVGGMTGLDDVGAPLIGSVHDEPICEVEEGEWTMERATPIMIAPRSWAPGLPLAVEGHVADRYRK